MQNTPGARPLRACITICALSPGNLDSLTPFVYPHAFLAGAVFRVKVFLFARLPWIRTRRAAKGERPLVQIFVRDNNVDQALKALKKKMQREGSFREMKRHVHYEKPSEKRARQKAEAVRRARKLARKRAQREGLLPMPTRR